MKTCKNCTTRYTNKFNYCPNCGAKWLDYRLTSRKITAEFTERYLGTENVFMRTCITLFRYPEDVINGYITGQRKKYVNVINFYFISLTLFGAHIFITKTVAPELLGLEGITINSKNSAEYITKIFDYMGFITSLLVPFYAVADWAIFYKKKYNFVEHLVVFGYVYSIGNILYFLSTPILILTSINFFNFSSFTSILIFILTAWYYKRIFALSFWNATFKGVLLTTLSTLISFAIMIIAIIIGVIFVAYFSPETLETLNSNLNGKEL